MGFGMAAGWCSDDEESSRIVARYLERGGNFIDTANFYGTDGGSERVLGKILAERRPQIVLATKYSLTMRRGDPNASGNHRKNMIQSAASCRVTMGAPISSAKTHRTHSIRVRKSIERPAN